MNRTILMLEPDDDDRYLTQAIFDEKKFAADLKFVFDSRELKSYLASCRNGGAPMPSLILLNFHAFPENAIEILKGLKADPAYRHIPTLILSGSANADVVRQCYYEGASSFIRKPAINAETKIETFIQYWFETAELV